VNFKVWGVTIATMAFALAQAPLLARHGVKLD
jgi:intracellular septation protein